MAKDEADTIDAEGVELAVIVDDVASARDTLWIAMRDLRAVLCDLGEVGATAGAGVSRVIDDTTG
jgi:hypothetical protein